MGRDTRQQHYGRTGQKFKAGLSVRQEITYTERLRDFFNGLPPIIDDIVPANHHANRYERKAGGYKLADEKVMDDETGVKTLGITLAERGLTGKAAERFGVRWQPRDIGRIRGALADRLLRIRQGLELPLGALSLTMDGVQRVGNWQTQGEGRSVALTPVPDDPVAEYLLQADHAADEILRQEISGYRRPEGAIMHFTVVQFGTQVSSKLIGAATMRLREHVQETPVTIELGNVTAMGHDEQVATIGYPRC